MCASICVLVCVRAPACVCVCALLRVRVWVWEQMKDCNVVASKLVLILDDLLWVLTDSQLKAMVQYAKSLSEAMERSAQQRKSMATEDQVHTRTHAYIHTHGSRHGPVR